MAHMVSGPYAGMLLADLGAEVIKVEVPGSGDYFRKWETQGGRITSSFAAYNRSKKSVTLNIKSESGRSLYRRLASGSDVIVENYRPGTLERHGIGYQDLRELCPTLVYCSISGVGSDGPQRDLPAYDQMIQATSGLWSQLTDLENPEPVGPAICDQLTGLYAVYGILGALVGRLRTGLGQRLEVTMLGSGIAFSTVAVAAYLDDGTIADKSTRARSSQSYAFVASDGLPFGVHLSTPPKFWEAFATAAGLPDLINDPRFSTKAERVRNYDVLHDLFQAKFATRTRVEWLALMATHDVPAGPLYDIAGALSDPQAQALEMVQRFGADDRAINLVGFPVRYEETPSKPGLPPPAIGEHNDAVFKGIGCTEAELKALREEGAI